MKKLILLLLFVAFLSQGQAQVIMLDELTLKSNPSLLKLENENSSLRINIPEKYAGHFYSNPLKFARENFDVQQLVDANIGSDIDRYEVVFKTNKGALDVIFDNDGRLISTYQHFKNVPMSKDIVVGIMKDNPGYLILDNKHIASSKGSWVADKEFYKVKLKNGKDSKTVRVDLSRTRDGYAVANN